MLTNRRIDMTSQLRNMHFRSLYTHAKFFNLSRQLRRFGHSFKCYVYVVVITTGYLELSGLMQENEAILDSSNASKNLHSQ
jgi:hypothetical protein